MKYIIILLVSIFVFSGCNAQKESLLAEPIKDEYEYKILNHLKDTLIKVEVADDVEEFAMYIPKDTITLRMRLKVANIEDILYIKLSDEGEFNNSKILRRVNDIKKLKIDQEGFVFEPSVEKNVVIIQLFIPIVYLSKDSYSPVLTYSFKRSSKSMQDSLKLYFMYKNFNIKIDDNRYEWPSYDSLVDSCLDSITQEHYLRQLERLNTNRIDEDTLKALRETCK